MRKIKGVFIQTLYYEPDFDSEYYLEHNADTLEKVLALDQEDLDNGNITLAELGDGKWQGNTFLSIVEDDE